MNFQKNQHSRPMKPLRKPLYPFCRNSLRIWSHQIVQLSREENSDMNSGRIMNLLVTIPAESRRVHIGKDIIRILGSPDYICVLQRKDRKSIVITPCAAVHPMSFRVPDKLLTDGQCKMRINGMGFVQSLLDANGLVTGKDYQFSGRYDIEKNAVVISLAANEKGKPNLTKGIWSIRNSIATDKKKGRGYKSQGYSTLSRRHCMS